MLYRTATSELTANKPFRRSNGSSKRAALWLRKYNLKYDMYMYMYSILSCNYNFILTSTLNVWLGNLPIANGACVTDTRDANDDNAFKKDVLQQKMKECVTLSRTGNSLQDCVDEIALQKSA